MRTAIRETLDELERQRESQTMEPGADIDTKMLAVGPETAAFLNTLIRSTGARRVVEVGGSMGYSTIWQGEAVEANGGRLTSLEQVPSKIAALKGRIEQAGLGDTIEVMEGDALVSLASLDGPYDLVLIDAWKDDYPAYFDLIFPKMRLGGLMVADNMITPAPVGEGITAYAKIARNNPAARSQLVNVGNGLELTIKLS